MLGGCALSGPHAMNSHGEDNRDSEGDHWRRTGAIATGSESERAGTSWVRVPLPARWARSRGSHGRHRAQKPPDGRSRNERREYCTGWQEVDGGRVTEASRGTAGCDLRGKVGKGTGHHFAAKNSRRSGLLSTETNSRLEERKWHGRREFRPR